MLGQNPIRPPVQHDGSTLAVHSIFATLQGEGPDAGVPAVFVRLSGCNLACDFCDTEFEDFNEIALTDVVAEVEKLAVASPLCPPASGGISKEARLRSLVVITGGEPLRQNIQPLCEALIAQGFRVQVETNGTLHRALPEAISIVCSPKNTGQGYFPIRADLLPRVSAFKFVVSATHLLHGEVPEVGQSQTKTPVYVQPMDEHDVQKNAANVAHATQLAMKHGYRLSLQLHKILGIP